MIVDVARTYSPLRPDSWCDSSIGMAPSWCAGYSSRKISCTRRSCTGFSTALVRHTTSASAPASMSSPSCRRTSSSSRAISTTPE